MQQLRNKRKKTEPVHKYKPLTQAEMLKEAAQTEIKNTESLQQLVAMEEETKMKALEKRAKYMGPLIRITSKKVDGAEQVCDYVLPSCVLFHDVFCCWKQSIVDFFTNS